MKFINFILKFINFFFNNFNHIKTPTFLDWLVITKKEPIIRLIHLSKVRIVRTDLPNGGADQIRTGDQGVADLRLSHLATAPYK